MWLLVFLLASFFTVKAKELTLDESLRLALENSPLIKSAKRELRAQELEVKAIRGALLPRMRLEENFTRTDVPAYAFMNRLNQERVASQDFDPARLNNPSSINNFETKLILEVPIWLGGKVQSAKRMAEQEYKAVSLERKRREEEVIRQVYYAYVDAVLAKEVIRVSQQAVEEAKEHYRLAERMHGVGIALLSEVLRAQVYLSKAEENLERAKRDYQIAKKGLEVAMGVSLGEFEVRELGECPEVKLEGIREKATKRRDIRAMEERLKTLQEAYRFTLSDNLPQVSAFAQYFLHSKDYPLGSDGKGYMVGLSLSWSFDLGLTTLRRAEANLERRAGLEERIKLMKDMAVFEVERAHSEYKKAMAMLVSAENRIRASKEVLRVMELRYKNGLARMVDILDAQTELDKARLERLQAVNACHKAYVDLLFSAGVTEEVGR
ncbi:MAG: TolC family protein [Aquificaceae bacterium]|nr:TolC family protein [Aquificaceae bacterium]